MTHLFLEKAKEFSSLGFEKQAKILLVSDVNVKKHCYPLIQAFLPKHQIIAIAPGDKNKNLENAQAIWNRALELNLGRNDLIIALGGGVISDLCGFAASTYKRGITCAYIPTSLMAMVDAAHGGKTGINLGGVKNSVGTFSNPKNIYIHVPFLNTLSIAEIYSGFAEAVKHGIIEGKSLWKTIESMDSINAASFSPPFIETLIQVKLGIVRADFKESNERKKLNLGHSLGHALESLYLEKETPISHGQAVITGIVLESFIAHAHFTLSDEDLNTILRVISTHFKWIDIPFSLEAILQKLSNDKKNTDQMLFTLPMGIGNVQQNCEVNAQHVAQAIERYAKFRL